MYKSLNHRSHSSPRIELSKFDFERNNTHGYAKISQFSASTTFREHQILNFVSSRMAEKDEQLMKKNCWHFSQEHCKDSKY